MKGILQETAYGLAEHANEMVNHQPWFKAWAASLLSCVSWLLGGFGDLVACLILLLILDFVAGLARAWKENNIQSAKMKLGGLKILLVICLIMAAVAVDRALGGFVAQIPGEYISDSLSKFVLAVGLRNFIIGYLVIQELLSFLEHLAAFGIRIPILEQRLRVYRDCSYGKCQMSRPRSNTDQED